MSDLTGPLLLIVWGVLCALQDARKGQIEHWLIYPALAFTAGWVIFRGESLLGASGLDALVALLLTLALTLPGYARGHFGAADVRMLLVVALAGGTLFVLLSIAIAALFLFLWSLTVPQFWRSLPEGLSSHIAALAPGRGRLAYGPFLLLALLPSFLLIQ